MFGKIEFENFEGMSKMPQKAASASGEGHKLLVYRGADAGNQPARQAHRDDSNQRVQRRVCNLAVQYRSNYRVRKIHGKIFVKP